MLNRQLVSTLWKSSPSTGQSRAIASGMADTMRGWHQPGELEAMSGVEKLAVLAVALATPVGLRLAVISADNMLQGSKTEVLSEETSGMRKGM